MMRFNLRPIENTEAQRPNIVHEYKVPINYKSLKQRFFERISNPNFVDTGTCENLVHLNISSRRKQKELKKAFKNNLNIFTMRMGVLNHNTNSDRYRRNMREIRNDYIEELESLKHRADQLLLLETSSMGTTPEHISNDVTPHVSYPSSPSIESPSSSRSNSITFETSAD